MLDGSGEISSRRCNKIATAVVAPEKRETGGVG
jgi:hypothetical protein